MNLRSVVCVLIATAIGAALIVLVLVTGDPCSTPGWFLISASTSTVATVPVSENAPWGLVACDRFGPNYFALGVALGAAVLFCVQGVVVAMLTLRNSALRAALAAVGTASVGAVLLVFFGTAGRVWAPGELAALALETGPAAAFAVLGALVQRRWRRQDPNGHGAELVSQEKL